MRLLVCGLIRLKRTVSASLVAGNSATGQVTSDRRRWPSQDGRAGMQEPLVMADSTAVSGSRCVSSESLQMLGLFAFWPRKRLNTGVRNRGPSMALPLRMARRIPVRYPELSETRRRQIRYGALAVAILFLATGMILFLHDSQRTTVATDGIVAAKAPATATGRRAAAGAASAGAATAPPAAPADDQVSVSSLQRDQAVSLIADARRQAAAGNFIEAAASLQKA